MQLIIMPVQEFKVTEMKIECPVCNGEAFMINTSDEIPFFGKFVFFTLTCKKCNFKRSDVMSTEMREPSCYIAEIKKPEDMTTKIIRSSTSTVLIPELGITIEPGEVADGYITNMEGLLERVENVVSIMTKADSKQVVEAARKRLEKVRKAKAGKLKFKVILKDPFGNSGLIGKNVKQKQLGEKELKKLKHNVLLL